MPKDGGLNGTHPTDGVHPGYAGGCPDDLALASYLDGRMTGEGLAHMEEHLSSCRKCALAVAELRDILSSPTLGGDHPETVRELTEKAKKLVDG